MMNYTTTLPIRLATAAAAALLVGLTAQTASAQGGGSYPRKAYPRTTYYQLPSVVRITPGMARILGPRRCDRAYPMDEWMACGTATGGPVGGRGS